MDNQFDVLDKLSRSWTPSIGGYLGALKAQQEASKLQSIVVSATKSCHYSSPPSEEETEHAMRQLDDMIPRMESYLDHIAAQKAQYDSVLLVSPLVKNNLKSMHAKTNELKKVVLNSTPEAHYDKMAGYFNQIDDAYGRVYGVYGH